jgi:PHP family Zn ribbon phosphoesterase
MALTPETLLNPLTHSADVTYRCPACGEMVDNRCKAEVFRHHDHVLHPQFRPEWYQLARPHVWQDAH